MKKLLSSLLVGLAFVIAIGAAQAVYAADDRDRGKHRVLAFDVAQDGSTFVLQGPTTDEGFPAQGAIFIIQGFVYPKGTLQGGAVSGTNKDGTAAFPDLVIGTWSCRGWITQDVGLDTSGVEIVGTQIFDLDLDKPGSKTIVTDGIDLSANEVDLNVSFKRAITGGTGKFKRAGGEQIMKNFGFNVSGGFDSTHKLKFVSLDDD